MTGAANAGARTRAGDDTIVRPGHAHEVFLRRGQTLRLRQLGGRQPAHLLLFAVADARETVSAGHSRFQGFHLRNGHVLVSRPPWYRPMAVLARVPKAGSIDLLEPGCDMDAGRRAGWDLGRYGIPTCYEVLRGATERAHIPAADLPDAVNLWYSTAWNSVGEVWPLPATSARGTVIEMVAAMDVRALVAPCVLAGFTAVGDYQHGAIGLSVRLATPSSRRQVDTVMAPFDELTREFGQPTPGHTEALPPELVRDPTYRPAYRSFPLAQHQVTVELDPELIARLRAIDDRPEASDAEVARVVFMLWCQRHLRRPPLLKR